MLSSIIQRRIVRIAPHVLSQAFLPNLIAERLIDDLKLMPIKPKSIIEIGVGAMTEKLYPDANILNFEINEKLFNILENHQDKADLFITNGLLPLLMDITTFFKTALAILKHQGTFIFSALGPNTCHELATAWAAIDDKPHVNRFEDMHLIGDDLQQLGFENIVMTQEELIFSYSTLDSLFSELQSMVATNVHPHRQKGLMGKNKWQKFLGECEKKIENKKFTITFEIIYGHATIDKTKQQLGEHGEVIIPLSQLQKKIQ